MTGVKPSQLKSASIRCSQILLFLTWSLYACSESAASGGLSEQSPFASEKFRKSKVQKLKFPEDDLMALLGDEDVLGLPSGVKPIVDLLMEYATETKKPAAPYCALRETDVVLPKNQTGYFIGSAPWDFYSPSTIFSETQTRLAAIEDGIDPMASEQVRTNFFTVNGARNCSRAGMLARIEKTTVGSTLDDLEHSIQTELVSFEQGRFAGWYSLSLREQEEVAFKVEIPRYNQKKQLQTLNAWLLECYLGYSCQARLYKNSAL